MGKQPPEATGERRVDSRSTSVSLNTSVINHMQAADFGLELFTLLDLGFFCACVLLKPGRDLFY